MSVRVLRSARKLLADGWNQVGCVTESGEQCLHDDEGVWAFDLYGAVYASAQVLEEVLSTWDALDLATDGTSFSWSVDPGRTHAEILAAVDRAILRSVREAR